MAYLVLGVLILLGVIAALRGYAYANPTRLASGVKWTAVSLAAAGTVLFLLREPIGILLLLVGLALPVTMHWHILWGRSEARPRAGRDRASRIETKYLSLSLDHQTGALEGAVLAGRHRGRRVAELTLEQLLEVREECRADDPEGLQLIEAYLDRVHGPNWRNRGADGQSGQDTHGATPATMTREEAYEILGLAVGASDAEIREAHHRLMMKMHPDRGGSNYLAAKINQAKDLLLSA